MAEIQNEVRIPDAGNPPPTGGIPAAGLPSNDPGSAAALNAELSKRGFRDTVRGGIMGAAAGMNAAQGALSPLAAFVQGMSAGMEIPGKIAAERRKELSDTVAASPFSIAYPEMYKDLVGKYPELKYMGGMPAGIVLPTMAAMAQEGARARAAGEEQRKTQAEAGEIERQNKIFEMSLKTKDPASIKDQIGLAKDFEGLTAVKDYQIVKPAYEAVIGATGAAGDKTMLVNFARMLNPTIRVNEQTMEAVDVSSIFDKNTAGLWAKAAKGEDLTEGERAIVRKEATRLYNLKERAFTEQSHLWKEKAAEAGFDPRVIGGSFGKAQPMLDKKTGMTVYVVPDGKGGFIEVGQ